MAAFGPDELRNRIIEAAIWCARRLELSNPRDCLRSVELRPQRGELMNGDSVERLVKLRRNLIDKDMEVIVSDGRLLLWFPDDNLSDGAAEVATHGYLDVDNQPPWDTWIAWGEAPKIRDISFRRFLVSWVPAAFVGHVESGVDINPEQCIQWLERDFSIALPASVRRISLARFGGRFSWGERVPNGLRA